jgi:hypothetical protein
VFVAETHGGHHRFIVGCVENKSSLLDEFNALPTEWGGKLGKRARAKIISLQPSHDFKGGLRSKSAEIFQIFTAHD